mgnify:CR=1 FL=1
MVEVASPVEAAGVETMPRASRPASGESVRVGGDLSVQVERRGEAFVVGTCEITTPLPAGYPDPTPPEAIDVKAYPVVRRAMVTGSMTPDIGMNLAFFPLFQHIKKREIAMTSPVEMDYRGLEKGDTDGLDSWTMSFLYRTTELAPEGEYGNVVVADLPAMTVLSIGGKGGYRLSNVKTRLEVLRAWLLEHPEWVEAGVARSLYYNGPEKRSADQWYEVQLPIKPAVDGDGGASNVLGGNANAGSAR